MNLTIGSMRPYIAALFAVFVWGAFPIIIKSALQFTSVDELLTLRFFISTILTGTIFISTFKKIRTICLKDLLLFIAIITALFCSQTYALNNVPVAWYIAVFTFVPILFLIIKKEKLNSTMIWGSTLAILGMLIFFFTLQRNGNFTLWNLLLLILSITTWVAYSLMTMKLQKKFLDLELIAFSSLVGFLSSAFIWKVHGFQFVKISWNGFLLCLLSGIVLPLALLAYSYSLRHRPAFAFFSQYLEPIFGWMLAVILLGESMNMMQTIAAVIIVGGTTLVGIASRTTIAA